MSSARRLAGLLDAESYTASIEYSTHVAADCIGCCILTGTWRSYSFGEIQRGDIELQLYCY